MTGLSDTLIASLRRDGRFVRRGEFELDRHKAREKMQRFQLQDANEYVLELVQVAHLLGASRIVIRADSDELDMRFDGEFLTAQHFHNLYAAAFARWTNPTERALKHLAFAVYAVGGLGPVKLLVDSGDSVEATRLMVRADGPDVIEPITRQKQGTRIYIKESLRPKHVISFLKYINGMLSVIVLLRERCAHCSVPIVLNGEHINKTYTADHQDLARVEVKMPHERGFLVLRPKTLRSSVIILQNGVKVLEYEPEVQGASVYGVIDSTRLQKDLSQRLNTEDHLWKRVVDEAITQSIHELIGICLSTKTGAEMRSMGWLRALMMQVFRHIAEMRQDHRPVPPKTMALAVKLEHVPLWQSADAVDGAQRFRAPEVSLAALGVGLNLKRPLHYARRRNREVRLFDAHSLLLPRLEDLSLLGAYLQQPAHDQTEALARKDRRLRNMQAWQGKVRYLFVSDSAHAYWSNGDGRAPGGAHFRSQVQVRYRGAASSMLVIVHRGRVLVERSLDALSLTRLHLIISSDSFTPTYTFDDVQCDEVFVAAILSCLARLPDAIADYVQHSAYPDQRLIQPFLLEMVKGTLLRKVLRVVGIEPDQYAEQIEHWRVSQLYGQSMWSLLPHFQRPYHDAQSIDRCVETLGVFAKMPLVPSLTERGKSLSLWRVRQQWRASHNVPYIRASSTTSAMRHLRVIDDAMLPETVFVAESDSMHVLSAVFGKHNLQPYEQQLARLAGQSAFLRQSPKPMTIKALGVSARKMLPTLFEMPLTGQGYHGECALLADGVEGLDQGVIWVHIHTQDRFVVQVSLPVAFGVFLVCVDTQLLNIAMSWEDVVRDHAYRAFCSHIRRSANDALRQWALRAPRREVNPELSFLIRLVHAVCVRGVHMTREGKDDLYRVVANAPLFQVGSGHVYSFQELRTRLGAEEDILYATSIDEVSDHEDAQHIIVMPSSVARPEEVLSLLFHDKYRIRQWSSATPAEHLHREHMAFLDRPLAGPPQDDVLWSVYEEVDGVSAVSSWVFEPQGNQPGQIHVRLCQEGRHVTTLTCPCLWGVFDVMIDDPGLIRWSHSSDIHEGQKRWHLERAPLLVLEVVSQFIARLDAVLDETTARATPSLTEASTAQSIDGPTAMSVLWMLWQYLGRIQHWRSDVMAQDARTQCLIHAPLFMTNAGPMSYAQMDEQGGRFLWFAFDGADVSDDNDHLLICLLPTLRWFRPLVSIFPSRQFRELGEGPSVVLAAQEEDAQAFEDAPPHAPQEDSHWRSCVMWIQQTLPTLFAAGDGRVGGGGVELERDEADETGDASIEQTSEVPTYHADALPETWSDTSLHLEILTDESSGPFVRPVMVTDMDVTVMMRHPLVGHVLDVMKTSLPVGRMWMMSLVLVALAERDRAQQEQGATVYLSAQRNMLQHVHVGDDLSVSEALL